MSDLQVITTELIKSLNFCVSCLPVSRRRQKQQFI